MIGLVRGGLGRAREARSFGPHVVLAGLLATTACSCTSGSSSDTSAGAGGEPSRGGATASGGSETGGAGATPTGGSGAAAAGTAGEVAGGANVSAGSSSGGSETGGAGATPTGGGGADGLAGSAGDGGDPDGGAGGEIAGTGGAPAGGDGGNGAGGFAGQPGGGASGTPGIPECRMESFEERDYLLCPHQGLDWLAARAACESAGSALVQIEGLVENTWVYDTLSEEGSIWIGANDIAEEGVWRWPDDTLVEIGYTDWATDQPNDNAVGGEDCAVLHSGMGGWNDVACDSTAFADVPLSYVCELP